jgi:CubicO group peptidase (beta-lactamase class C family)
MPDHDIAGKAGAGVAIGGWVAPGYEPVAAAFRANFIERGEVGASLCATRHGETVVDLWGGLADPQSGRAWERDTVSIVFSCTKAATALCAHMLAEQGRLDLYAPVTTLWPAFAQGGKQDTTTAMMLAHTAPVPHLRDPVAPGGYADWDTMVRRVAEEPAWWQPGTRQGYHGVTYAWTVGNMVRLAAGEPLSAFFAANVAGPLGLDFHIGLPESEEYRVAPMIAADPAEANPHSKFLAAVMGEPGSLPQLFLTNNGKADFNSRAIHAAELGSANGISNARGLAGMYAPLALGGGALLRPQTVLDMARVCAATFDDATLRQPMRFGLGYMARIDNRAVNADSLLIGERAFGHVGMGGSVGFADPEAGLSFGYTMNRMGAGILLNGRGQSLVDATYACLRQPG